MKIFAYVKRKHNAAERFFFTITNNTTQELREIGYMQGIESVQRETLATIHAYREDEEMQVTVLSLKEKLLLPEFMAICHQLFFDTEHTMEEKIVMYKDAKKVIDGLA